MVSLPFDTLEMVERLEGAGVPAAQAKVQVSMLAEAIRSEDASISDRFVSKQDVVQELASIRALIEKLNAKIDSKIDMLDAKIDARIGMLNTKIDAEIGMLDTKIDKSASDVKSELIRWVVTVGILQMALIAGLVLKLAH
jgi:peptidoglycan hydrolase CwlO-like protein